MRPLSLLASFLSLASALNPRSPSQAQHPAQGHTVHQFPNGTWVENIALRPNGDLLVTLATSPSLYLISPLTSSLNPTSPQTATLLHSFPPFSALLGITSTHPDQYYAIAGNLSLSPLNPGLGTYAIFSINLSTYNPSSNTGATISLLTSLPSAGLLNGLTTLSAPLGLLLAADSIHGAIWLINASTGTSSILLQEPEMLPPPNSTLPIGINGVHVLPSLKHNNTTSIYFSNTATSTFHRIPFSLTTMKPTGATETLFTGHAIDDFAIDELRGVVWLAGGTVDEVLRVGIEGGGVVGVYGGVGKGELGAPTSVVVGRKGGEEGMLFVTTQEGRVVGVDVGDGW
ncbi:hypothetical protein V8E51_002359 [Hyaloscypha variabilis]